MDTKDKKFQEALKQYDNKEYKEAKKSCDKILEKQPQNGDALALKGLTYLGLNNKEEAKKLINEAIKINMKNPVAWQFYAIYSKDCKNYSHAIKCYSQSIKYDPNNANSLRDLAFLQLFLRQYADFCETARKSLELRSNLLINWTTSALGYYLAGNLLVAFSLTESLEKIAGDSLKRQEKHELLMFKANILSKMNKHKECIGLLLDNEALICDKIVFHEKIIQASILMEDNVFGIKHCNKAFEINSENVNYFIWYLNLKLGKECKIKEYNDLLSLQEDNKYLSQITSILLTDLKPRIKSRILTRLELAVTMGDAFRDTFNDYFLKNIKINIPSFFSNIKFIYSFQKSKLSIIEEILTRHLKSIETNNCLDQALTNKEVLNLNTQIIWVYFYAAQHYDHQGELEKALYYINLAIDATPSVVEFYMTKAKILKHGLMFKENALALGKAKLLDLGDRYLNAKHAKCFARMGNPERSSDIMEEYVRKPLVEDTMNHFQCMWYEFEIGNGHIQNDQYLHAHRLFEATLNHFNEFISDQNDFYLYCLRRYMLNDFNSILTFLDKMFDNKYVIKALYMLDMIKEKLLSKDMQSDLAKEYEDIQLQFNAKLYTFTTQKELIESISKLIYNFCLRIQSLTRSSLGQYICLKYFILNSKPLLAFKSLLLLKTHEDQGFYFSEGFKLFSQYFTENQRKMNITISDIIQEQYKELSTKVIEYQTKDTFLHIQQQLYTNNKCGHEGENGELIKQVLSIDMVTLRKTPNVLINELITIVTLNTSVQFKDQFKKELNDLLKISADENQLKGNLSFWDESKANEKVQTIEKIIDEKAG